MKEETFVLIEVIDSVGILTLNHPPANYLPAPEFLPAFRLRELLADESLKGLIIRGEGRNFSAGGDLEQIFSAATDGLSLQQMLEGGLDLLRTLETIDIPVIAAINGVCFGGGLETALACHFRVASENALLAFPEVNQNLAPGMGGTTRLTEATGRFQSARMILGGDMIGAGEAKSIGLVDYVAPKDQAFEYSLNLMMKMTHDRPVKVIRAIMKTLMLSSLTDREESMREETSLFCDLARDESVRRKAESSSDNGIPVSTKS
ncbi:MAG: enoyl-CoA hydratase/isomerase family protein [Bacteroidota bacterium]